MVVGRAGGAVNFVGGELGGDAAGVDADGRGVGLAGGREGDAAGVGGTELAGDGAGVGVDNIGGELEEMIGAAVGESGAACASLPSSQGATTQRAAA